MFFSTKKILSYVSGIKIRHELVYEFCDSNFCKISMGLVANKTHGKYI